MNRNVKKKVSKKLPHPIKQGRDNVGKYSSSKYGSVVITASLVEAPHLTSLLKKSGQLRSELFWVKWEILFSL